MDPVRRSQWRTGALVGLVFVLGAAAGGFGARAIQQRRMRELIPQPARLGTTRTAGERGRAQRSVGVVRMPATPA